MQGVPRPQRAKVLELDYFLAGLADADQLDGCFAQHFEPPYVGLRIGGQIAPTPRVCQRLFPARERLVHRTTALERVHLTREKIDRITVQLVTSTDLQLGEPREEVQPGKRDTIERVHS